MASSIFSHVATVGSFTAKANDATLPLETPAWPWYYQSHGTNALDRAWKCQVQIRKLTRQGTTKIRIASINWDSSVANVMCDDHMLLPLGLIGAQRITVGDHPYMSTISM